MIRTIQVSLAILFIWIGGLVFSAQRTTFYTHHFYNWLSKECGSNYSVSDKTMYQVHELEIPLSKAELLKRIEKSNEPFKKHISIIPEAEIEDVFSWLIASGTSSKGTHCLEKYTVGGSFFRSSLWVEDAIYSSEFVVVISTKIFGL